MQWYFIVRNNCLGVRRLSMELKGTSVQLFFLSAATIVVLATGTPLRADSPAQDAPVPVTDSVNQGFLFNGLFEGDLKLTEEEIRRNYRINDDVRDRSRNVSPDGARASARVPRAATSESSGSLWPDAVIRYDIDSNAPRELIETIYTAMEEWEHETCLRFLPRHSDHPDYVYFTTENVCDGDIGACCSDSVGRKGGEQKVSLHGSYCNHEGTILHLIGHVIGFWHEESRPDRDDYIFINYENVDPEAYHQFQKRDDLDVDYQGVGYDYSSIMHLPLTIFTCCYWPFPLATMEITNYAAYGYQGNPPIGQLTHVSDFDGEQASRLYNCPGSGVKGTLTISELKGQHFPVTGEDVYVKVTAVNKYGHGYSTTRRTVAQPSTASPTWDDELQFGEGEWQFFRIRVYDDDTDNDDPISMSETVVIKGDTYEYRDHCLTTQCTTKVRYLYEFVVDRGECSPNPCQNGATCYELTSSFDGSSTYICNCPPGWAGTNCDSVLPCLSNPCQNGGTCHEYSSAYQCTCKPGWSGTNCETKLHCYSDPCQNGGACHEGTSTYTCACKPGWTGTNCETKLHCYNNPCQNGGTCHEDSSTYTCACHPGWTGTNCETKLHCYSNPCQNGGACHEYSSTYTCACHPGWTGTNCETKLHCYNNPCQNGGACHEYSSTYTCACHPGWTGTNCETKLHCYSNPCQNGGACHEYSSTYACACHPGWTGTNCETKLHCYSNPCQNGGTCHEDHSAYRCVCKPGWTGTNCETKLHCYSDPCQNGGTCHEYSSAYQCTCKPGWTGTNCETKLHCYSDPCQNGGTCHEGTYTYTCDCPPEWSGKNCGTKYCYSSPCQHGGICHEGPYTYTCDCPPEWSGKNCEYYRLFRKK